jgi:predicted ATPase
MGGYNSVEDFDAAIEIIFRKDSSDQEPLVIDVVVENPVKIKLSESHSIIFDKHYYHIEMKLGVGIIKEHYHVLSKDTKTVFYLLERNETEAHFNSLKNGIHSLNTDEKLAPEIFNQLKFQPMSGARAIAPALSYILHAYCDSFFSFILDASKILSPSISRNQRILLTDGRNLSGVLQYYLTHKPEVFKAINDIVKRSIPNIDAIESKSLGVSNNYFFSVKEKDGKEYVFQELSEGTDLFIGLITAMVTCQYIDIPDGRKGIIFIEEPEKNLHPQLMEQIITVAKSLTDKYQVFITTHSTDIVAQLEAEDIILLDKNQVGTRMHRIHKTKELSAYLKEFSLDQIWLNNDLDGGTIDA